jgi:hypothetical protein
VLQQWTGSNDFNFCLNDVAHTSPHLYWLTLSVNIINITYAVKIKNMFFLKAAI